MRRYDETVYLMGSPNNAKRLRRAIRQLAAGNGKVRKLIPAK
jgi:PHD/YefM family antitoxin component YafN of YafNO toxin-antitoxin module